MTDEHINRINELARKKKAEGLTPEELEEQAELRKAYIEGVKGSLRSQIEGVKVVDEEGNDVTPDKLKKVQAEKGIHGRTLEDLND
ncbi:DUF896 family protein [Floricoccus penangensis]|nr:DUF896 family protein [Floricoccus penangensis]URZ88503.1 DUF896 family protein [Floricoccus penangensis]